MDNIDGGLGFRATLNIDDFNVSADAMNRRIRDISGGTLKETASMDQAFMNFAHNAAAYITTTLVGGGMMGLMNSIIQTRGQFQQLSIAFDTMLGSESKSKALMNQIVNTAAKTPFDLMGVASGAKQLLAYGESADKVSETLVRLGNIASGLSIPLNDIVYLYGTTMVQGRLYAQDVRQFTGRGIPLVRELAKEYGKTAEEINGMVTAGKIGFPEVERVIKKMTDSGGQFYNLMEKQSKSLSGMVSNLSDAWDTALNKIGEDNQGVLTSAISSASYVVQHMQTILDIVKSVAIAYGSYKAAIVLNTLALKGHTGVALIDNTVMSARVALMKASEAITGKTAAQTALITQAEQAHVASLQAQLTADERINLSKQLRVATIERLLTAQQLEYMSNLGVTTSSANYEAVAMQVLTVEQRAALNKIDLTEKSAIYQAALEKEVAAKTAASAATLEAMRADVRAAAAKLESAKIAALSARSAADMANYELYVANRTGEASRIATATKKYEAAVENEAIARKAALAASTDFHSKKKILEATATNASATASKADTVAKNVQTASTTVLTTVTHACANAMRTLWATIKANPIGWIITAIGLAISAFTLFRSRAEESTTEAGTLANAMKKATDEFGTQAGKVDALNAIIHDGNATLQKRNEALSALQKIIPGYNAQLTQEGELVRDNTDAIKKYLEQLEKQIQLKAAQEDLEAAYKQKRILSKQLQADQEASDQADAQRNSTYLGGGAFIATPIVGAKESGSAAKNLDETKSKLSAVKKEIDDLNKEIEDNSKAMAGTTTETKTYSQQVSETKEQVKKLKEEIKEIRSGKTKSENPLKDLTDKTKELQEAETSLATLTGQKIKKNGNDAIELTEKETAAALKAEQSKIAIMDEGYEKRRAQLDLQHKQTMAEIQKEQNDLEKSRTAAGKGGLTTQETSYFTEQRKNEEINYNKQIQKLFDGEIEYKKSQYELYFRWVENMGTDAANKQFETLLKGGASYKAYLENEIKKLTNGDNVNIVDRQGKQDLTEGQANNLINLKIQYQEVTGAKTAMDSFKESISDAINNAETLAEKLKVVADARSSIANGTSGIKGADNKLQTNVFLDEQQNNIDKEVAKLVDKYKDYAQQRKDIEKKFNDDIALLTKQRNDAMSKGDTATAEKLSSSIAKATTDKGKSLMQNDLSTLKDNPDYIRAFENLKETSTETLNSLLSQFEQAKEAAAQTLDPEQLREYTDTMMSIVSELNDRDPFAAIARGKKELAEAEKTLADAERNLKLIRESPDAGTEKEVKAIQKVNSAKDNVIRKNRQVKAAEKDLTDTIKDLCDNISKVGDAVGGQTGQIISLIGDIGSFTMMAIQGFSTAAEASAAAIATIEKASVILTIISAAFQIASKISSMFGADYGAYNKAKEAYESYIKVLDEVISKQKELVETMSGQNAINSYKYAISLINEEASAARTLGKERLNAGASLGSHSIGVRIKNSMSAEGWQQAEDVLGYSTFQNVTAGRMEGLFNLSASQLEKLKNEAPIFWAKLDGDVRGYLETIIKSNDSLEEMKNTLNENLTGTDFSSFSDSILSDLEDIDMKASDVFSNVSDYMRKALIQNMYKTEFKDAVQRWYQMWSDAMNPEGEGGSDITGNEQQALDTLKESIITGATSAAKKINDQFKTTESEDALAGAVRSMSEETGNIVAGRLNAAIINQSISVGVLRDILICNLRIADNTYYCRHLEAIANDVKDIKKRDNSLLSQGIS